MYNQYAQHFINSSNIVVYFSIYSLSQSAQTVQQKYSNYQHSTPPSTLLYIYLGRRKSYVYVVVKAKHSARDVKSVSCKPTQVNITQVQPLPSRATNMLNTTSLIPFYLGFLIFTKIFITQEYTVQNTYLAHLY